MGPMVRNYVVTIYRNFRKHKVYSVINIVGLIVGITATLLLLQYLAYELSYDNFHEKSDRIYRVNLKYYENNDPTTVTAGTYPQVGPTLKENYPEIEEVGRIHQFWGDAVIVYTDELGNRIQAFEDKLAYADPELFKILSIPLIKGNPDNVLVGPDAAVISESLAIKYFGPDVDPVGKVIEVNGRFRSGKFRINGIMADLPSNSHMDFVCFMNMEKLLNIRQYKNSNGWKWNNFGTYVLLSEGSEVLNLNEKIEDLLLDYKREEFEQENTYQSLKLEALNDIHIYSEVTDEDAKAFNSESLHFLLLIALFILSIAWVNYINLATARALERAREVGIRKAVGATRLQLITQFIIESWLINLSCLLISIVLLLVLMPALGGFFEKEISIGTGVRWEYLGLFLLFFLFGSSLSALIPAFILSMFKPVDVLKTSIADKVKGVSLRQILVIAQFSISLVLIAATFTVFRQLNYMKSKELGFNVNELLVAEAPVRVGTRDEHIQDLQVLRDEIGKIPAVSVASTSSAIPGEAYTQWGLNVNSLNDPSLKTAAANIIYADYNFKDAYQFNLVKGRYFDRNINRDRRTVILNETAVKELGFRSLDNVVDSRVVLGPRRDTLRVLGIFQDFNWNSVHTEYVPIFLRPTLYGDKVSMRINTANLEETIAQVEDVYNGIFPATPFEFFFANHFFNRQYQKDEQFGRVFGLFTFLAIFIACLGLFGLASFTATKRVKEIGIRKVLGATEKRILTWMFRDYLKLIALSIVIAVPLAYMVVNNWLDNYAFRIDITPALFLIPAAILILIAVMTVSYQTLKAARTNPVSALRTE